MADDPTARAWRTVRRLPRTLRSKEEASVGALTQAALTDDETLRLERIVAVMSMLEGHADVVMDSAESAVPSTRAIRARFTRRRMEPRDRKSTRLNSSHVAISYAVFCLKKKK